MRDGIIHPDTKRGVKFGFTSDRFSKDSYLWKCGNTVAISFIVSLERGNLRRLFKMIWGLGHAIHVPTPLGEMPAILEHYGFRKRFVDDEVMGVVEVWARGPKRCAT